MKLNLYLLTLILILSFIYTENEYNECSAFKPDFQRDCKAFSDYKKICEFKNKKCQCHDIKCEDLDRDNCGKVKINFDYFSKKCVYDPEKGCIEGKKLCSEWNLALYDPTYCALHKASKEGYECRYLNGKCIENLGECYKFDGTKESCESIILLHDVGNCIFINKMFYVYCKEERKFCDEPNTFGPSSCPGRKTRDPAAKCIALNGKCIESYERCENYTINVNKEKCESIILTDNLRIRYKCVYKNNLCMTEKKYYDKCEDIKTSVTKEICENNIPLKSFEYKCVYDSNKGCVTKMKRCSDFIFNGTNCEALLPTNYDYRCRYINNACVEFLVNCEKFDGTKESCEYINSIGDDTYKCVYKEEKGKKTCTKEQKYCTESPFENPYYLCKYRKTKNVGAKCIEQDKKCIEIFDYCEDYNTNVNKEICESIKPYKSLGNVKCVYENNLCISKPWFEFEVEKFKSQCENIIYRDHKHCHFVNNFDCLKSNKKCLEINSINGEISEEICNEAIVSNENKKCVLKKDKNSCEEIDIPTEITDNAKVNDKNNENIASSSDKEIGKNKGEICKSKFANFIAYIFLFL